MNNHRGHRPCGVARRIWPRRSDLMRRADWIEAALLVAVITTALVLLPIALALGSETYANNLRSGAEQSRTRHQTTAILIQDAPPVIVGTQGQVVTSMSDVAARWTPPGGTERTGTVRAANGLPAGATVPIWVDETGNRAAQPTGRAQAAAAGAAIAIGTWATATGLLAGIFLAARAWLHRSRADAWEREWARVEPDWTHRPT